MNMRSLVLLLVVLGTTALARAQCATPWTALGAGVDNWVRAMAVLPNGDLVVGGDFTTAGGAPADHIARWDGTTWSPLGGGADAAVRTLLVLPGGDLIAGGHFTTIGGIVADHVARWDGQSWTALGGGTNQAVWALARLPSGDLAVGGGFTSAGGVAVNNIARWDGATWSPIGAGLGPLVSSLAVLPSGDLVAGGLISGAGLSGIARWDGSNWLPLGSGLSGGGFTFTIAWSMLVTVDGDLLVGGAFIAAGGVPANHIARWDGATWWPLGTGVDDFVSALALLPDGDLLAGGDFTGGVARWNGVAWATFGGGADGVVNAFAALPDGARVLGGGFHTVGGGTFAHIARVSTTCPAGVVTVGAGCSGSGGTNVLDAAMPPWLGHTCTARATGLAVDSLAVAVYGFDAQSLPLSSVHPLGLPGCSLLASDDILLQVPVLGGEAHTAIPIPNDPAIGGASFWHQVVAIERMPDGSIAALTSTNALALTIGSW